MKPSIADRQEQQFQRGLVGKLPRVLMILRKLRLRLSTAFVV